MSAQLSNRGLLSFAELSRALNEFPDQTDGIPCSISDVGEPYVAFLAKGIARPGDEKIVEQIVVADMCAKLDHYFEGKIGRIYWRSRLETDYDEHHVVLRFDANGPDIDFITDRKCVKDKNWIKVAAYCRLFRAACPIPELTAERKVA